MGKLIALLSCIPLLFNLTACEKKPTETITLSSCVITSQGIGEIVLGDTKNSILKKIPTAKFENSVDGDGVDWVVITYDDKVIFSVEDRFNYLEVQDAVCKTSAGAYVGMTISQLKKFYGEVISVGTNDANSFEEVIFEKSPNNIFFKGYALGYFDDVKKERTTRDFNPDGIIEVITVTK